MEAVVMVGFVLGTEGILGLQVRERESERERESWVFRLCSKVTMGLSSLKMKSYRERVCV